MKRIIGYSLALCLLLSGCGVPAPKIGRASCRERV